MVELSASRLQYLAEDDDVIRNLLRRRIASSYSEFRAVIEDDLLAAIGQLELNPQQHPSAETEDHTTHFLVAMLVVMGYSASHNTQQGGNVDITVEQARKNFRWIAEAKKFGNVSDLRKGYLQLATRYTAVPDEAGVLHGGLIGYLHRPNPKRHMDGWKSHFGTLPVAAGTSISECPRRRHFGSFISQHEHKGTGLPLRVWHLCVGLYFLPEDTSGLAATKYKTAHAERVSITDSNLTTPAPPATPPSASCSSAS